MYKINLLVLFGFSCVFEKKIFLKSYTFSNAGRGGEQSPALAEPLVRGRNGGAVRPREAARSARLFSLQQGSWKVVSPKMCLCKTKLASDKDWFFLFIEFQMIRSELRNFLKGYT